MLALFSQFSAYTLNFLEVHREKQDYYHFAEKVLYLQVVKKPINIFRKTAIAVLFIEILTKKSRKLKRINQQNNLSRDNLKNHVSS
jgi:hypothetical protein